MIKKILTALFLISCLAAVFGAAEKASAQATGYSVSMYTPGEIYPGTNILFSWNGPEGANFDKDWVGIFKVGEANKRPVSWVYTTGKEGFETLVAPSVVGTYELRYFKNDGFTVAARSAVFGVGQAPDTGPYSVQASPQEVAPGGTITVTWSSPAGADISKDWIGVVERGMNSSNYKAWKYTGSASGQATLTMPTDPGSYEVRYFKNGGYDVVATSDWLRVTDPVSGGGGDTGTYSVSAPRTAVAGGSISVTWNSPFGANVNKDWIALYRQGETNNRKFISWKYTGSASGSLTFGVPAEAGTYEIRYLKNNAYTSVATSQGITVSGGDDGQYRITAPRNAAAASVITVTWSAPSGVSLSRDWIALYRQGSTNKQYVDWKYTGSASGTATLALPAEQGTYEVRYLKNNAYTSVAASDTITVGPPVPGGDYSVSVASTTVGAGGTVSVSWNSPAGANISRDWIAIYGRGMANTAYLDWRYVRAGSGTATLRAPQDEGEYEVRYLKNNGFTSVAASNRFRVANSNLPKDSKIIAFGDSLVAGFGSTPGNDAVSRLSDLADITIENQGRIGDTTAEGLSRLQTSVLSKDPDAVILLFGGNDYRSGVPKAATFANLQEMITRIRATGAEVILVGLHRTVYEAEFQQLADDNSVLFVPNVLSGIVGRPDLTADLFHPNDAGYEIVAERIYSVLKVLLD